MVETRAELPFTGDQIVCLTHNQAARSGPARKRWGAAAARSLAMSARVPPSLRRTSILGWRQKGWRSIRIQELTREAKRFPEEGARVFGEQVGRTTFETCCTKGDPE